MRNKLNTVQRMEVTYGRIQESNVLQTVLSADAEKIKETIENIDEAAFQSAVDTILQARKIYIVGIRSCAPLASFLAFYLNQMFEDVILCTPTAPASSLSRWCISMRRM